METRTSIAESALEYGEILTDSHVAQFLASRNWVCQVDRGFDQVWSEPGSEGDTVSRVLLPRDKSFVDYNRRLVEALTRIGQVYDWRLSHLAEQVSAVHADLFFLRVDQSMSDGTIPLRQASKLLESIDDMIRSAAMTVMSPSSSGRGRVPNRVNNFLNDDVRMGHTKHGSFIITVAARLDEPEGETTQYGGEPGSVPIQQDKVADLVPSFTRQVMTTLARSLDVTQRFTARGDDFLSFDAAVEQGLRLPMVQALRSIGQSEGLRKLDMSFEWAPLEPVRVEVPSQVSITRPIIELLPEVEARLVRVIPAQDVILTGPVVELKRGDEIPVEEDEGEIVVRADVDGAWRRVTVPLAGVDYDWAIRAHRKRLPFTVSGVLEKRGRLWILTGEIAVDHSYLEHQLAIEAGRAAEVRDQAPAGSEDIA
jgi:hypothetical protein